jgi:hypothetical protein
MWMMLQQDQPDDYVIETGEAHSVREFAELAVATAGLDWRAHIEVDRRYFRHAEVDYLLADVSKARMALGWEPSVSFPELVQIMVESDLAELNRALEGGAAALRREDHANSFKAPGRQAPCLSRIAKRRAVHRSGSNSRATAAPLDGPVPRGRQHWGRRRGVRQVWRTGRRFTWTAELRGRGDPSTRPRKQTAGLLTSGHGDVSLSMAQWRLLHRERQNQGRSD